MLWLRNNIWDHKRFKLTFWHKILYTKFHLWPSKVLSLSLSLSLSQNGNSIFNPIHWFCTFLHHLTCSVIFRPWTKMDHPKAPDFTTSRLSHSQPFNWYLHSQWWHHSELSKCKWLSFCVPFLTSNSNHHLASWKLSLHGSYSFCDTKPHVQNSSKPSICGPFWCHQICIPPSPNLATSKVQPHRRCAQPCQNSSQLTIPCSVLHLVLASLIRLLCQKWRL